MTFPTHGLSRDKNGKKIRLFRIWTSIKTRCFNPNDHAYPKYGGRGITLCDDWLNFKNFYDWAHKSGYEENLTIERKNVNDGYYRENCTWITRGEQASNRTNTKKLTYKGQTKTMKLWSKITGIEYPTIHARITKYGWSVEKTLSTPSTINRKTNIKE